MVIRAAFFGFVLWFLSRAAFRFFGQLIFYPDPQAIMLLFLATPVLMAMLCWVVLKVISVEPGDEGEAAIAYCLPGMLLDAYAVNRFAEMFPNLDPALDHTFGALMLTGYGFLLFAGLCFTKLAPKDERVFGLRSKDDAAKGRDDGAWRPRDERLRRPV